LDDSSMVWPGSCLACLACGNADGTGLRTEH
jgi:hypothetical protein